MNRENRLSVLREHETDCYTICMTILRCEDLAAYAARQALLQLWQHDTFMELDPAARPGVLTRVSVHAALEIRKTHGTADLTH
ncbi:hypothetical protein WMW72_18665 [Paenibacillus filicis]|uniref:Uncharacterized protein n=1 Tax=Paenibacillus filicis TaxID=669464 RepID=A0ABU9DME7_9BACL